MTARKIRKATISRKTAETQIKLQLKVDGNGKSKIQTDMPFLDHMLTLLAKHSLMDLTVKAKGDLHVDIHHTNEDLGIVLGIALTKALGNKNKIRRYGFAMLPMDEVFVRVALDISGRPSLYIRKEKGVRFSRLENYSFHDAAEFLKAFCLNAGINMHVEVVSGHDSHHIIEGMFKAVAKALDAATQIDPRVRGIPSTQGLPLTSMIAIIDYGMGNLRSVSKALEHLNGNVHVTCLPEDIDKADKIVLPGVGAFGDAVDELNRRKLMKPLKQAIARKKPFLGICLGLQLLFAKSEESPGKVGLASLEGEVKRFHSPKIKIPHMGWNNVNFLAPEHALLRGLPPESYFYFVHSYYAVTAREQETIGTCLYGEEKPAVIVGHDNIFATQFHPEKSQEAGLTILKNFIDWDPS